MRTCYSVRLSSLDLFSLLTFTIKTCALLIANSNKECHKIKSILIRHMKQVRFRVDRNGRGACPYFPMYFKGENGWNKRSTGLTTTLASDVCLCIFSVQKKNTIMAIKQSAKQNPWKVTWISRYLFISLMIVNPSKCIFYAASGATGTGTITTTFYFV